MLHRIALLTLCLGLSVGGCKPATGIASFDQLDYGLPVETADVDGTDLAYVDLGEGPQTLVLIHGLGSYMPAWSNNLEALSRNYRVIALDLPGYGRSAKPNAPYSMRYFVAKVRGLLEQLDVHNPVLVGHSMGGQISLTYALMYPQEVQGLVLASPAGLETFEDGEAKWLANAVTPEFTCLATDEAIYSRHVGNFHKMPKDAEFMVRDRVAMKSAAEFPQYCIAVSRSVAGMLDGPVHARLPSVSVPTLVTFGKNDTLIPNPFLHGGSTKRLVEREAKRIPGVELVVLPKAGHMAHFERASEWNATVLEFVAALPAVPPRMPEATADPEPVPSTPPEPTPVVGEPEPEPAPEPVVETVEEAGVEDNAGDEVAPGDDAAEPAEMPDVED
jgi:pimeloyl-ACP methyl ester carboxylesterase